MAQAPPPSLSLRHLERGGEVLDTPQPNPFDVLRRSWDLVLLIHGYNNDLRAGREAYEGFRLVQREIGQVNPDRPATDRSLVDIYWPGDADWGIVSALYYPWSIEKARRSAAVLAHALDEAVTLSGFKQIDVVAHSMGCRLTLELLKQLRAIPGVLVRRVVFMAGAVPTFVLEPGDDHEVRAAYDTVLARGAVSLFSPDDMVLSLAFPLGQTLGGAGEGWFPTALGHERWASPLAPPNLDQQHVHGAGHSDYWGWDEKTRDKARVAGLRAREVLSLGAIPEREVASRPRLERSGPEARVIEASPRETLVRGVESS